MAHSPKEALIAAKQDLLAAYSTVHSSLGRLINLIHSSEPRAVADALGSDEEEHHNGAAPFYNNNPPRQPTTIPTPPGSIPGGKKKRVKRERDPNAPKRPASAYILFQNAVRQEMRAANPTADYKELARQIGDRWKNLSEEAKRPWSEAGKLAMTSWNIQNKEYKTSHPEITSPHNQTAVHSAPAPRKRRSRAAEVDAQGNPLPKKRGRPSKAEKDGPVDHPMHPPHHVPQQSKPPAAGQPSSMAQAQMNAAPQVSPQMEPHSDSDMDEGEDDEGSEARSPEPNHPVNKMAVQPNGILA
ncbi:hypothetical protein PtA15_15A420 [Puccinia triticina]|uniref:HMG box domain-containing protein n=1 Tax=Puccinia triticina TaxID=208348 RepID=A0ABY7D3N4_9BASI|nr:uncharacterized protein PtA15_15A420 [Puccinia triticina]WAQ92026.1 hypothetical protein PtA15_15A420 [Puccinia triticina]